MRDTDMFSRAVLAGYDPARLHAARLLVVGLGALGQNVLQGLMLSGIGHTLLIDFDDFEDHNATRSPFFPTAEEREWLGDGKAAAVASRAMRCNTAPEPRVWYVNDLVQMVGDGPIRWADVVVCAVDSVAARAWLAERCRTHNTPMVEAGFSGPRFNLSAFAAAGGAPCYRCFNGFRVSAGSCTQYALAAEAASVVPAIQTTAAVLGGLMAEQVIQILHDDYDHFGERLYGDIRRLTTNLVRLGANPECPGQHAVLPVLAELAHIPGTLDDLLAAVFDELGRTWLMLAEPAIVTQACTRCARMCLVRSTESAWLRAPHCEECGGPWPLTEEPSPQALHLLCADGSRPGGARQFPLAELGLRASGAVTVQTAAGRMGVVALPGSVDELWQPAVRTRPA